MSKSIAKSCFIQLPSGAAVHPCRLIHRDGTLMWKHAFLYRNEITGYPETAAQECHIIKTALRLEELNVWVSKDLELWDSLVPYYWFDPSEPELCDGISCYFKHSILDNDTVYSKLSDHIHDQESLELRSQHLFFKRC